MLREMIRPCNAAGQSGPAIVTNPGLGGIPIIVTGFSYAAGIVTLTLAAPAPATIAVNANFSLSGFVGSNLPLNGVWAVASVSGSTVTVTAPGLTLGSTAPGLMYGPGLSYQLNANGSAIMQAADANYFATQGWMAGAGVIQVGPLNANTTATNSLVLPAGAYIDNIVIQEFGGAAVTAFIIGTASGGGQIVASSTIAANSLTNITDALLLLRVFSATAPQPIFIGGTFAAGAQLNVTIMYRYF